MDEVRHDSNEIRTTETPESVQTNLTVGSGYDIQYRYGVILEKLKKKLP